MSDSLASISARRRIADRGFARHFSPFPHPPKLFSEIDRHPLRIRTDGRIVYFKRGGGLKRTARRPATPNTPRPQ